MREQNIKYFKIYRWDPEKKGKPYECTYPIDLDEYVKITGLLASVSMRLRGLSLTRSSSLSSKQLWSNGARCAAEDQERAGPDADVPAVRYCVVSECVGQTTPSDAFGSCVRVCVQIVPRGHLWLVRHEH